MCHGPTLSLVTPCSGWHTHTVNMYTCRNTVCGNREKGEGEEPEKGVERGREGGREGGRERLKERGK